MSTRNKSTASSMTNDSTCSNSTVEKEISRCQSHSWVDVSDQKLTDRNMEIVVKQGIINKQCTGLNLRYNQITSVGISVLADALRNNTILQILYLSYNSVSDMGVQYLANALSTNSSALVELQLEHNDITDEGARHLAAMLKKNRTLTHLGLAGNQIGDQGVQLLSESLTHQNSHLEVLNIRENTSVTDSSVEFLVDMIKHSPSLEKLSVNNCTLSKRAIAQLQQATNGKDSFILGVDA